MLRLVVYSPETPPRNVIEVGESELGHLAVFEDGDLLANIVIRPFTEAHEVEVGIADTSWEWLARTRVPTSPAVA
jgi:hypothetical protein